MTPSSRPASLPAWLAYLESLHPKSIAMGLDRVSRVHERLGVALACPVIVVTGTNGKGSTCALLDAFLRNARYRVGRYTSPHLLRYNERIAIDGVPQDDASLVAAFDAVEDARTAFDPPVPLTYFEFGTLAALWHFARQRLDAAVLEVGLGGRLDAVNVVDADVAVVTSIGIDHVDYLGPTRKDIAREKAGIFRAGRAAICGERDPPRALMAEAARVGAPLYRLGVDYEGVDEKVQWRYSGPGGPRFGLPIPALRGTHQLGNAATAIAALACLRDRLPVGAGAIRDGLMQVELPGRFTVLPGRPTVVLDVAHNPQAAAVLARTLGEMGYHRETIAVFGVLKDKDIDGVIAAIAPRIDRWHVAALPPPRGSDAASLASKLRAAGVAAGAIEAFDDVGAAWRAAKDRAGEPDRIVVFGSFLTVAAALTASGRADSAFPTIAA